MKVVVDTNCLLRILPEKSEYHCLWDAFVYGKFELCYTTDILQEYEEILSRFYSSAFTKFVIETILSAPNAEQITVFYKWLLITADPDDNKFVDCAISANAACIITNDRHFNVLRDIDFPKINILTIGEFKEIICNLLFFIS
jgi:putative PIN family toxin of toxin-antitoxin system